MSPGFYRLLAGGAFAIYALTGAAAFAAAPAKADRVVEEDHRVIVERAGPDGERRIVIRRGDGKGEPLVVHRDGDKKGRHVVMIRHGGERHAERLRALLQLKPGQEPALKAYLTALEPPEHDQFIKLDDPGEDQTTLERLAAQEKAIDEHSQAMKARLNATRSFYAQLEPAQQKAFDEMPSLMGHHAMGPMPFAMPVGSRVMMMRMPMGAMGFDHDFEWDMAIPPIPPMPPLPPLAPEPPAPPR